MFYLEFTSSPEELEIIASNLADDCETLPMITKNIYF